jgi:hypothetical protein
MNYKQCKSVLIRVFFIMLDALRPFPENAQKVCEYPGPTIYNLTGSMNKISL